jgi:hypothetical protein
VHFMAKKQYTSTKFQINSKFQWPKLYFVYWIGYLCFEFFFLVIVYYLFFVICYLLFPVYRVRLSAAINTGRKLLIFFNSPFIACQASFISNKIIVTGAFAFSWLKILYYSFLSNQIKAIFLYFGLSHLSCQVKLYIIYI